MPKLTLSMEKELLEQAKRLAKANGTSVSAMFRQYVRAMARQQGARPPIGPIARQASGLAHLPKGMSYRKVLEDALLEKYGLES